MDKVKVDKNDLLSILKTNRDKHEKDYNDAMGGYRLVAEAELKKKLKKVRAGEKFTLYFKDLREPDSHVQEYQNVIDMLEVSTDMFVEISMEDYLKYYKNEWNWCTSWKFHNSGYATLYNVTGVGAADVAKYKSPSNEE